MKNLLLLFFLIPFMVYSQNIQDMKDKNGRKFIVQKNDAGEIINVIPSSGIDFESAGLKFDAPSGRISGTELDGVNGFNWQLKYSFGNAVFTNISFATPLVGYISAELGQVFKTTDGGNTWSRILNLNFPYYWYGVFALSKDTLVISGFNNQAAITTGILRWSYDGGVTWTNDIALGTPNPGVGWLSWIYFWNKDVGIVGNEWSGAVYYTTTGGRDSSSWHYVLADPAGGWFAGKGCFDVNGNVWLAGISQLRSTNFGVAWSNSPHVDNTFDGGVDFLNDQLNGLTAGGSISPSVQGWVHKTTDGGSIWSPRLNNFPYPIRSVKVFTNNLFLGMGGAVQASIGGIFSSTDAGATWNLDQNTDAEMFTYTLSYPNPDSIAIWSVGSNGGAFGYTGKLYKSVIAASATPVELTAFTAAVNQGRIVLNWTTATETNNRGFEIERKVQEGSYQTVGFISGHGTTTEGKNYTYIENNTNAGIFIYRLKQVDFNGSRIYSKEVEVNFAPQKFILEQNFPNPFNPSTIIKFSIPEASVISLKIRDILGNEVKTILNEQFNPGNYEINWNADNNSGNKVSSGIYFYELKAGNYISTKKMILMR